MIVWHSRTGNGKPIDADAVNRYVDQWLKGPVTHYFVNINGQMVYYNSKVFDQHWQVHRQIGCQAGKDNPGHDRFMAVADVQRRFRPQCGHDRARQAERNRTVGLDTHERRTRREQHEHLHNVVFLAQPPRVPAFAEKSA